MRRIENRFRNESESASLGAIDPISAGIAYDDDDQLAEAHSPECSWSG